MPPPSLHDQVNSVLDLPTRTARRKQIADLAEDIFVSLAGTLTVVGIGYLLYRLVATLVA